MDQTPATTPAAASAQPQDQSLQPDAAAATAPADSQAVGFGSRGRLRRRARFLRKARELAYRDLGGLVYSLHHFGQRNDALVLAKLSTLSRIDAELRALESNLAERQPVTVLREAGVTACPRCAAIHSGEDRFCPNCGLPLSRNVDLPIAGAAAGVPASVAASAPVAQTPTPAPSATPANPSPTPASTPAPPPATQAHATLSPSDASKSAETPGATAQDGDDDQPTEIIRPPAASS